MFIYIIDHNTKKKMNKRQKTGLMIRDKLPSDLQSIVDDFTWGLEHRTKYKHVIKSIEDIILIHNDYYKRSYESIKNVYFSFKPFELSRWGYLNKHEGIFTNIYYLVQESKLSSIETIGKYEYYDIGSESDLDSHYDEHPDLLVILNNYWGYLCNKK